MTTRRVRTNAKPRKVRGIVFAEWKSGPWIREWCDEHFRASVRLHGALYLARVDGRSIGGLLPTLYAALKAAAVEMEDGA